MKIKISKNILYVAIIWAYFLLEKAMFTVADGNFRVYFLFSLVVLVKFLPCLKKCSSSKIFLMSVLYMLAMFVSSLCSNQMKGAFINSISSILYIITAYSIAVLLVSEKIEIISFQKILYSILLFLMIFGLFQLALYNITGISFYDAGALSSGQISGMSAEPNGHGKAVGAAIVFSIPVLIRKHDSEMVKKYRLLLVAALITLFLSMTRNALYCVIITMIALCFFYFPMKNERKRLFSMIIIVGIVIGILYVAISSGLIELPGRSMEKLNNLFMFSEEELMNDDSGNFRLPQMIASLEAWLESVQSFLIGHGPGQVYATVQMVYTRLAGNGIIASLPGVGVLGTIPYAIMLFIPICKSVSGSKAFLKEDRNSKMMVFAEQSFALGVYIFAMDFIATSFYYAEMWVVVALGIYWELKIKSMEGSKQYKEMTTQQNMF